MGWIIFIVIAFIFIALIFFYLEEKKRGRTWALWVTKIIKGIKTVIKDKIMSWIIWVKSRIQKKDKDSGK